MVLELMFFLALKHTIVDFMLQPKYMWANKGTFGHPGGLAHAGLHVLATYFVLIHFPLNEMVHPASETSTALAFIACVEFIFHYLIDWAKMNLVKYMKWKCNEHPEYWYVTGVDQFLHYSTYILIILLLTS